MKKTLGEVVDFLGYAEGYLAQNKQERSQLTYALQKQAKKYTSLKKKFGEDLEDIKADAEAEFCLKDKETGAFLERDVTIPGGVVAKKMFDKKGEEAKKVKIDKALKTLRDSEVDFEPYFVDIPEKLPIEWVNVFTDFVFKALSPEEEEQWYLKQVSSAPKKE